MNISFDDHGVEAGVWSGSLTAPERPARVCVICRGEAVAEADLTRTDGPGWAVRVPLPAALIGDGIASLILVADDSGQPGSPVGAASVRLARLSIAAGKVLDEDAAAEIAALRAELELLKREFRRFAAARPD